MIHLLSALPAGITVMNDGGHAKSRHALSFSQTTLMTWARQDSGLQSFI
jgi:hypothetical protein